ncbi:J domain-containing protein [Frankia sp. Ea1.12]|uniref:J domain-containing protein n=1 Tax=Parafrankia sp. Ea1.12 TaxID=573499 RepID=UPI000DD477DF
MLRALHGQNAYEMLNISASVSDAEIKEAYRALARARHPDRTGGTDVAEMALINVAYEVLRDLRTDYDRHLAASRTGRHGTSERGHTAAEDRRADTGDADRTRGGHPAGGLWDVPSARPKTLRRPPRRRAVPDRSRNRACGMNGKGMSDRTHGSCGEQPLGRALAAGRLGFVPTAAMALAIRSMAIRKRATGLPTACGGVMDGQAPR